MGREIMGQTQKTKEQAREEVWLVNKNGLVTT